jgi:hypothetical protein
MEALAIELLEIAIAIGKAIREKKSAEEVKRDARDRLDVAIDNALAKKRLDDRKRER